MRLLPLLLLLSLGSLLTACGEEEVELPAAAPGTTSPAPLASSSRGSSAVVLVNPERATVGGTFTITAIGFPENAEVEVGAGPPNAAYEVLARARTDDRGRLRQAVTLPDLADDDGQVVFVVATTDQRARAVSEPFELTDG